MVRNVFAVALMLIAPVLVLILWAHVIRPRYFNSDDAALLIAGMCGLAGAATARWRAKWLIAVVYAVLLVPALLVARLLAVCSTGDCL